MLHIESAQILRGTTPLFSIARYSLSAGELHILSAPNGAGKSSFAAAVMGHPDYELTGTMLLDGQNLHGVVLDERARLGLFVSYQQPLAIPGLSVRTYFLEVCRARGILFDTESAFELSLAAALARVGLERSTMDRGLYEGFSGGERKRLELAHLSILKPRCIILDEVDSGLDEEGIASVESIICEQKAAGAALLVITHNAALLRSAAERVWTIHDQQLVER